MDFKTIRKAKGWSQMQVAKELGISINTWIQWERGVANPNEENIKKLKAVFGEKKY